MVLGGFGDSFGNVFSMFFHVLVESRDCKNIVFPLEKINKIKGSGFETSLKKRRKIYKKSIQDWNERIKGRISLKKWIWQGLGLHLEWVWDALGRLLGASWRSGASLGRLLIVFSGVGNPAF